MHPRDQNLPRRQALGSDWSEDEDGGASDVDGLFVDSDEPESESDYGSDDGNRYRGVAPWDPDVRY